MSTQLSFAFDEPAPAIRSRYSAAVYTDYESWRAHFSDTPKTTDDTYTPQDVYECILRWLGGKIAGRQILRPFYPGGDYQSVSYGRDAVVVDNPPFSIQAEIVRWYVARHIPFFLFCNGMTAIRFAMQCTVISIGGSIQFENGALVCVSFLSNLFDDIGVMSAPDLWSSIQCCASQQSTAKSMTQYRWPCQVLSMSDMNQFARYGLHVALPRSVIRVMKKPRGVNIFGGRLLVSTKTGRRLEDERRRLEDERRVVVRLDGDNADIIAQLDAMEVGADG